MGGVQTNFVDYEPIISLNELQRILVNSQMRVSLYFVNTMMNNKNNQKSADPTDMPTEPWGFIIVNSSDPTDMPTEPWQLTIVTNVTRAQNSRALL